MSAPTTGYTIGGASTATTAPLTVQNTQADLAADYLPMYSGATLGTVAINLQNLLGIGSQVMATNDIQTVKNKSLDNTNVHISKDTSFTLQNASSTTKQAQFLLSSITAGQLRIFTLPDYNGTIATTGGTETFTNKTLTSPIITNATITSDLYAGAADADSGVIYGMTVTNGIIASAALANTVNTAALQTGSVDGTKLSTSAITIGYQEITTTFTTTSTSTVDVTSLSVTVTMPSGGRRIEISAIAPQVTSTQSAGNVTDLLIREGSTTLTYSRFTTPVTGYGSPLIALYSTVAAPGSHTYKVSVTQQAAGTLSLSCDSTRPAFILVKVI